MATPRSLTLLVLLLAALLGLVTAKDGGAPKAAAKRDGNGGKHAAHEARGLFDMFAAKPKAGAPAPAPAPAPPSSGPAPNKADGGSEYPQRAW